MKLKGDEKIGVDIVRRALEEPLRQIAANAGLAGRLAETTAVVMSPNIADRARAAERADRPWSRRRPR